MGAGAAGMEGGAEAMSVVLNCEKKKKTAFICDERNMLEAGRIALGHAHVEVR